MENSARALPANASIRWLDSRPKASQRPFLTLETLVPLALAHAALGVAAYNVPGLAALHGFTTLLVGLFLAGQPQHALRAFYVAGYLATADVFWRMTKAAVPWEFSKYGLVLLVFLIAMRRPVRVGLAQWASLYFFLLLPSVIETVQYFGVTDNLRKELSFNLSGPFALAAVVFLCSGLEGEFPDMGRLLGWMLMPIISTSAIALYSTLTAATLNFSNHANFATSGGYGPNQVSAILGLGAFLCLLLALNISSGQLRTGMLALGAVLLLQTLITFSRGGAFNFAIAASLLALHYVRSARARRVLVVTLVAGLGIAVFLVLPSLNAWTDGNFSTRFTNIDTTGRKDLAEADLQLFEDNLLTGVGAGLSKYARGGAFRTGIASHTEFTRLLAEHGLLGLFSIFILMLIGIQAYRLAPTVLAKGWVASLVAWSLAEMAHSAMRIAAISFVFGIATFAFHRSRLSRPAANPQEPIWQPRFGSARTAVPGQIHPSGSQDRSFP